MTARRLSSEREVARLRALLGEELGEAAFLRSPDPAALAGRLAERLESLLLAGEDEAAIVDGLVALGHRFDFNDQFGGDGWSGQIFASGHLKLEYRLDFDGAPGDGRPTHVDLEVEWS